WTRSVRHRPWRPSEFQRRSRQNENRQADSSQNLVVPRRESIQERRHRHSFFSLHLHFAQFERFALPASRIKFLSDASQIAGRKLHGGDRGLPNLKLLTAQSRVGTGPRIETAHTIQDLASRPMPIDATVLFLEDWGVGSPRIVLRLGTDVIKLR